MDPEKQARRKNEVCPGCKWSSDHLMRRVIPLAGYAAAKVVKNRADREDVIAMVLEFYAERLSDGRLFARWNPQLEGGVSRIASKGFLCKRVLSALKKLRTGIVLTPEPADDEWVFRNGEQTGAHEEWLKCWARISSGVSTWTGTIDQCVCALELWGGGLKPLVLANPTLMAALRKQLTILAPEQDMARAIDGWLAQKVFERDREIEVLAAQCEKARKPEKVAEYQMKIDKIRDAYDREPFGALDLMRFSGLTRANADMRLRRYRAFLRPEDKNS